MDSIEIQRVDTARDRYIRTLDELENIQNCWRHACKRWLRRPDIDEREDAADSFQDAYLDGFESLISAQLDYDDQTVADGQPVPLDKTTSVTWAVIFEARQRREWQNEVLGYLPLPDKADQLIDRLVTKVATSILPDAEPRRRSYYPELTMPMDKETEDNIRQAFNQCIEEIEPGTEEPTNQTLIQAAVEVTAGLLAEEKNLLSREAQERRKRIDQLPI